MLLESLSRSAARDGTGTEAGCIRQAVHWRLDLTASGHPAGRVARLGEGRRGVLLEIPGHKRSGTRPPAMLLDKADFTLGAPVRPEDNRAVEAARQRHVEWSQLVSAAAAEVDDPAVRGLAAFARGDAEVELPEDFDPSQFLAVYVSGHLPTDSPELRAWWRRRSAQASTGGPSAAGQCSVCGQLGDLVEFVDVPIRGLTRLGGSADMALVSANNKAFEHFGLPRAAASRVCRACGETTHHRLNTLIGSGANRRFLDDVVVLWWSVGEVPDLMTALFEGARPEDVSHMLSAPWRGRPAGTGELDRFEAVVLGTSKARVVVRSWVDQTLPEMANHLAAWFADTAMVTRSAPDAHVAGIALLDQCLRPPGRAATTGPGIPTLLFGCALLGTPLPDQVAQAAVRRVGARGEITHPRAALLRCWLIRKGIPMTEVLNEQAPDAAYRAGRLLALLDQAAYGATRTSLIDRFYSQLSSHPGLVVGRLIELHQHHMAKLKRDRPAQANRLQHEVEDVLAGVEAFPAHLDLAGRSRFALGLYHQQAADRARRAAYQQGPDEPEEGQA